VPEDLNQFDAQGKAFAASFLIPWEKQVAHFLKAGEMPKIASLAMAMKTTEYK